LALAPPSAMKELCQHRVCPCIIVGNQQQQQQQQQQLLCPASCKRALWQLFQISPYWSWAGPRSLADGVTSSCNSSDGSGNSSQPQQQRQQQHMATAVRLSHCPHLNTSKLTAVAQISAATCALLIFLLALSAACLAFSAASCDSSLSFSASTRAACNFMNTL